MDCTKRDKIPPGDELSYKKSKGAPKKSKRKSKSTRNAVTDEEMQNLTKKFSEFLPKISNNSNNMIEKSLVPTRNDEKAKSSEEKNKISSEILKRHSFDVSKHKGEKERKQKRLAKFQHRNIPSWARDRFFIKVLRSKARYVKPNEAADSKKCISVGKNYQAALPIMENRLTNNSLEEIHDETIWDPNKISQEEVERFLVKVHRLRGSKGTFLFGSRNRDDEQALYTLRSFGYSTERALKEVKRASVTPKNQWTEEECDKFELGMRSLGKNFSLIQREFLPTKTVSDLIQFYYLWKKSERYDMYVKILKLYKKNYKINPGSVDLMEQILNN